MDITRVSDTLVYFTRENTCLGTNMGSRMVAIKLSDGNVWIHSPIPLTPEIKKEIDAMGEVAYIIAPNLFHHLHLKAAHNAYPNAQVFAPKGIEKKCKDLPYTGLKHNKRLPWAADIQQVSIEGIPAIKETVFYHENSKTLIVTDLFFNVSGDSVWSKLFFTLNGIQNKCTTSRLFKSQIKDKLKFNHSIDKLNEWPYERLIMAHGKPIKRA